MDTSVGERLRSSGQLLDIEATIFLKNERL